MATLMSGTMTKVRSVLRKAFPEATVDIGSIKGSERVSGHIIWTGFDEMDQLERQRRVYRVLREGLKEEASLVSLVLAYTPDEWAVLSAD
jgi:acid stress-induced BolA-like protein IbaG/YrbA